MALKNQPLTVTYLAWNTSTNTWATGDAANHTLKLIQDNATASPTNSPTEPDATSLPGRYNLALTAGDMNFNCVTLGGKSSTANVAIFGPTIVTERGVLPAAAPATSGGLPTVDSANGVKLSVGTGTGQINAASGKVPATVASGDGSDAASTLSMLTGLVASGDHTQFTAHALAAGGASVTVAGYAAGQDPGSYILATPANKLATDSSGYAMTSRTQPLATPRDVTSVADGSMTVNDADWGSVNSSAGRQQWTPTVGTVSTPAGTLFRTFSISTSDTAGSRT